VRKLKLKAEFGGELQVPGNHQLVQELIESDLALQFLALTCHHHQSFWPGDAGALMGENSLARSTPSAVWGGVRDPAGRADHVVDNQPEEALG
jgi:hypothetical protein